MTLNESLKVTWCRFIDQFQQDLNDPASTIIAVEEAIRIMKEEHKTEISILIGMI